MYISRIKRALLTSVIGVAIILGSTGFVIQTHECQHNGDKVYVLAGHDQQENRCCDHNDLKCCESETDYSHDACGNPEILSSEPCCTHEFDLVQLPGFPVSDTNIEREIPLIAELMIFLPVPEIKRTDISTYRTFHNNHGGKDILIINCQLLN